VGTTAVLFVGALVGAILAGIGTLVLGGTTTFLTRGVRDGRRKVILAASLFPFACLAWAAVVLSLQGAVNEGLLNRDPGFGDMWACPLPNGYAVMMIDETDHGWLYNPKTQTLSSGVSEQDDTLIGVRVLQVSGPYIFGGLDSQAYERSAGNANQIDTYFLLDTRTGKHTSFLTYDALDSVAQRLGTKLNLERIIVIYSRYRFTWSEAIADFLLCLPPTHISVAADTMDCAFAKNPLPASGQHLPLTLNLPVSE
jgi:hypothetical protein